MKATALIEKGEDGNYCIVSLETKATIIGEGASVKEAKEDFENSLREVLEMFEPGEDKGDLEGIEFEYKYDVASVFNYFSFLNVSKFAEWAGINPALMRQYKSCKTYMSEKRARVIEEAFHKAGEALCAVIL